MIVVPIIMVLFLLAVCYIEPHLNNNPQPLRRFFFNVWVWFGVLGGGYFVFAAAFKFFDISQELVFVPFALWILAYYRWHDKKYG